MCYGAPVERGGVGRVVCVLVEGGAGAFVVGAQGAFWFGLEVGCVEWHLCGGLIDITGEFEVR